MNKVKILPLLLAVTIFLGSLLWEAPPAEAAELVINEDTIKVTIDKVYPIQINPYHMPVDRGDGTTSTESVAYAPVLIESKTDAALLITATPTVTCSNGIYLLDHSAESDSEIKYKSIFMFFEMYSLENSEDPYSVSWTASDSYQDGANRVNLAKGGSAEVTIPANGYAAFRIIGDCVPSDEPFYVSTTDNAYGWELNPLQWTEADVITVTVVFTFVADVHCQLSFEFELAEIYDDKGNSYTLEEIYGYTPQQAYVVVDDEIVDITNPISINSAEDFNFIIIIDYVDNIYSQRFVFDKITATCYYDSGEIATLYEWSQGNGNVVALECTIPGDSFADGCYVTVTVVESVCDVSGNVEVEFVGMDLLEEYLAVSTSEAISDYSDYGETAGYAETDERNDENVSESAEEQSSGDTEVESGVQEFTPVEDMESEQSTGQDSELEGSEE